MAQSSGVILCIAYILGLLSTTVSWGGYAVVVVGIGAATVLPRLWRVGPKAVWWLIAGIIGLLASLYLYARTPQPAVNDISKFIHTDNTYQEQTVTVQGRITSTPRLTRSQRGQFWLETTQIDEIKNKDESANVAQSVTGKLYVTVPLLQVTGLYPGQAIAITGNLYKPKPAANPGSFDFRKFLAQEGTFAGISGQKMSFPIAEKRPQWGWWVIRQRIVRSQVRFLGSPEGPLAASMVLGSKAVDLPYDIRDSFIQVGLAHALAASGFQTSLILGLLLALTKRLSPRLQVGWGVGALIVFLGLTGLQPSVLRAVVMGFGALIALAMRRKVKPLGSLLIAATLLLIFNPLWIWDLGFQLSFLATLGLLVTAPPLIKSLDWMPPAIACLIAVPVAASVWTLPLQLHVFGIVPLYSLVVNILTTPLISIISIVGIISALIALIWPLAGSALSWLLYFPIHWLIGLVEFFSQLPGNSIAPGTISVVQLLAIYGLFILAWYQPWWQRRWWLVGVIGITLVLIPVWQTQASLFRVTLLANEAELVLVIQEHGQVTVINSGDADNVRFTVLPFLQQQGINQIDWAIATNSSSSSNGWLEILKRLQIKNFYDRAVLDQDSTSSLKLVSAVQAHWGKYHFWNADQKISAGSTSIQLINAQVPILQLTIQSQTWLVVNKPKNKQEKLSVVEKLSPVTVLCWFGESLGNDLLKVIKPKVAIASTTTIDPQTLSMLRQSNTQVFFTGRDGAIQWTPGGKFETTIVAPENSSSVL